MVVTQQVLYISSFNTSTIPSTLFPVLLGPEYSRIACTYNYVFHWGSAKALHLRCMWQETQVKQQGGAVCTRDVLVNMVSRASGAARASVVGIVFQDLLLGSEWWAAVGSADWWCGQTLVLALCTCPIVHPSLALQAPWRFRNCQYHLS